MQSPASPHGQNRQQTGHGTKRCHNDIQKPGFHKRSCLGLIHGALSISSGEIRITRQQHCDLVAVHVGDLSNGTASRISPFVHTNAVLTSEAADTTMESSIVQPPAVMNAVPIVSPPRCVHEIGGRHLLTIERVVARELSRPVSMRARLAFLSETYDRHRRIHLFRTR